MKNLLYLFGLILFLACQSKQEVMPTASIELTIYENITPAAGASVSIFSTQASYDAATTSSDVSSALATLQTSANGTVTFDGLNAQQYWFYVTYENNAKSFNNLSSMNTLADPLNPASITKAEIKLTQSPFHFYIAPTQSDNLPYKVKLDDTIYNITDANAFTNPVYINKNPGTYTYQITGSKGCVWAGTTSTLNQSNNSIPINLNTCSTGLVTFWVSGINTAYFPITVVLNNTDTVGVIKSNRTTAPTCTDTVNTASIYRDYNSYSYTAKTSSSFNNGCVITGMFSIDALNNCQQIQLIPQCGF